jgi:peptidoglycan/xylan/chitin deacetylase (PgdA/CDA1 family)
MTPFTLTVLMYHYVRDPGDFAESGSGIPGLSMAHFEAQLDYIHEHYSPVTWADLQRFLSGGDTLPPSPCLITFDDGIRDHFINAYPALKSRGLSGLFFTMARRPDEGLVLGHKIHYLMARLGLDGLRREFLALLSPDQIKRFDEAESSYKPRYSGVDLFKAVLQRNLSLDAEAVLSVLVEQVIGSEKDIARHYYLSDHQITEMKAGGMHFGGHTHSHPWFDWIGPEDRAAEVKASADTLNGIEARPWAFAYPYGGLAEDTPDYLRANQFSAAFTTKSRIEHKDPFYIGRLDGEELSPTFDNLAFVARPS